MAESVISLAASLRAALATFEPAEITAADCAVVAEELAATEKACAAARVLAGVKAVAAGTYKEKGFNTGADWMARHSGSTGNEAKRELRTGSQLKECPETLEALLSGEVSIAQAGEIAERQVESPGSEHYLLEIAKGADLSRLRDKAREHRMAGTDPAELHRRQHQSRYFRHWRDGLGMVCFQGALTPEIGLPFVRRVEAAAQRTRRESNASGVPLEEFDKAAADALAGLVSAEAAGSKSSRRTDLVIVCDLNAWRRGHAHTGEPCHIVGGAPIPVELARELSQDAFLKGIIHDGVNVHTIKHAGRYVNAPLRTALDIGRPPNFDGKACEECGRSYGLQDDHIDPVANDGPTSFENLHPLCWHDHRAKTERDKKAGLLKGRGRRPERRTGKSESHDRGPTPAGVVPLPAAPVASLQVAEAPSQPPTRPSRDGCHP